MRFGVGVGNMNGFNDESGPNACIDVAQAAEDLGFDSVWTNDHIVVPTQIESRYPYNDLGEFPAPSTIQCFDPLVVMCALGRGDAVGRDWLFGAGDSISASGRGGEDAGCR